MEEVVVWADSGLCRIIVVRGLLRACGAHWSCFSPAGLLSLGPGLELGKSWINKELAWHKGVVWGSGVRDRGQVTYLREFIKN